jgi:polyferredoxin
MNADNGLQIQPPHVSPLTFHRSAREVAPAAPRHRVRKPFVRRRGDVSQQIRLAVQAAFGSIALVVGIQFYFWVRYYETAGATVRVSRPPGVEAWLPIAALMNTKAWLLIGEVPGIHPAGMFMFIAFVAIAWLGRKAFCSWVCPVGTISEQLWQFGASVAGRTFTLPRVVDIPLRSLKYILLALFAYVVVTMPVAEIRSFLSSPYGLVADVKMLDFFRRMGQTTAVALGVLIVSSIFVKNVWCRLFCPYGALLGLVALVSPTRIRRDPEACIDCAKCRVACPSHLPVDTARSIRSAECTACMACVSVCPAVGALDLTIGVKRHHLAVGPSAMATAVVVLFLGIVGAAWLSGHWHTTLPDAIYRELIPHASALAHPR